MPATWLHFVGKTYYTRGTFVREAKKYGVTRRVSLNVLKNMAWGDRVLLAIMDGKTPIVFGEFRIERISGLSAEAVSALERLGLLQEIIDFGGIFVKRGCGCYVTGPTRSTNATIREIVQTLEALMASGELEDPGKPMVSGKFILHPLVRLKDIRFRQGFRLFDYETFEVAYKTEKEKNPGRSIPAVKGHFYVKGLPERENAAGAVQAVAGYERAEKKALRSDGASRAVPESAKGGD